MMFQVLSGKEFNEKYPNTEFYKLTNKEEIHNSFQFKTGLNTDTVPFNPTSQCEPGGIYFTELQYVFNWVNYGVKKMAKIRKVEIPADAQVYVEKMKFKADKIILNDFELLDSFLENKMTEEICMAAVSQNGWALEYVPNELKTEEFCLAAVTQDGWSLYYVPKELKTEEICMAAVSQKFSALEYVPNKLKQTFHNYILFQDINLFGTQKQINILK